MCFSGLCAWIKENAIDTQMYKQQCFTEHQFFSFCFYKLPLKTQSVLSMFCVIYIQDFCMMEKTLCNIVYQEEEAQDVH